MNRFTRRAFLRLAMLSAAGAATGMGTHHSQAAHSTPDSSTEWDNIVAAATAEGRLALLTFGNTWGGPTFRGFQGIARLFEQTFPGITVDWLGEASSSVWLDRLRKERRAGAPSFDLALVQPEPSITQGASEGMWAPVKPLLLRGDVLEDRVWRDGMGARYMDAGKSLCFGWEYMVIHMCAVNTGLVQDGEITSIRDLLAPKWTGKIIARDPRIGLGLHSAAAVAKAHGTGILKQLLVDQHPTFATSVEPLVDGLVSGRFPISLGVRPKALARYQDPAIVSRVKFIDLPDADVVATTSLLYLDRAPHPAAAKLFANWILTGAGQRLLTGSLPTNSARMDVAPYEPAGIATPGKNYYEPDKETNYPHTAATKQFIMNIIKG